MGVPIVAEHYKSGPRYKWPEQLVEASMQEEMGPSGGRSCSLTKAVGYWSTQEPEMGDSHHLAIRVADFLPD